MGEKAASGENQQNVESPGTSELLQTRVDETKAKCDELREQVIKLLVVDGTTQSEIDFLKLALTMESVKPLLDFASLNNTHLGKAFSQMQEKHTTSSVPLPSIFSFGTQPNALNSRDLFQHAFSQIRTLS